ncbi:MAG: DUF2326 domain-containing protein [Candidatus Aminicenantes bacterium]|nr:DUF2326 domain-containing protein [Candidatus Aminicenantes bacterium]
MILKRLYTTPEQLFEPVEFVPGINYIFGKKAKSTDTKKSLNGIGKSTFLDLVDFCLLANFNRRDNKRLFAAYQKGILKGISVVLEFEIGSRNYILRRSFDKPAVARLAFDGNNFRDYKTNDLRAELCDLIFYRDEYPGVYNTGWYWRLLRFYLKIQKPKKERFTDPISYIKELTQTELNRYHLFLMNIDNTPAHDNYMIRAALKRVEPTIREIKKFIDHNYGLKDIPEAGSKARKLKIEIEALEEAIQKFKLGKQYRVDEDKADLLTAGIKELRFQNHLDRKKITVYLESLKDDVTISSRKIKNLYNELNELLAQNIKKALDEAIQFKKNLVDSRREFLNDEVEALKAEIAEREKKIAGKEDELTIIFDFLDSKEAIKDLTKAFNSLSERKNELGNIESQIKLYNDLSKEKNKIEQEEKKLEGVILEFKDAIEKQELELERMLTAIYHALYPELKDTSIFDISPRPSNSQKIEINILPNTQMFSKGKNQGRTLVYDLTILFHSIENNLHAPRFLVHDGIFDGVDKAHFIALYEYLEEQKMRGKKFQYILTYNEEGTLKENFGRADLVTTEKIESEAILILTPGKKLLGDF